MTKIVAHCDGSCWNKDGHMGIGVVIYQEDNQGFTMISEISEEVPTPFPGTNNIAEWEAIIKALRAISLIVKDYPVDIISIRSDSQIVINQMCGKYQTREHLVRYKEKAELISSSIPQTIYFSWVERENEYQQVADRLSKLGNPYFKNKERMKNERIKG